jgi:hypothetical protein
MLLKQKHLKINFNSFVQFNHLFSEKLCDYSTKTMRLGSSSRNAKSLVKSALSALLNYSEYGTLANLAIVAP